MLLLDHSAFLEKLRENPADLANWLVYADWLDEQNDPTGAFIRLSLDFTTGAVYEPESAHANRLYALAPRVHSATRKLLGAYRSALPLRLQVCNSFRLGHNPPREVFGYERTIIFVAILAGKLSRGARLRSRDGSWKPEGPLQGMEQTMKAVDSVDAGSVSTTIGLFYFGHHHIPDGTILVEEPPADIETVS
jgi:uncharacterized protein (TIGR02996 family)